MGRGTIAVLCATLLLSGCISAEKRQRLERAHEAAHDAKCRSYGAVPGTQGYLQCRLALTQLEAQQDAAQAAAAQRALQGFQRAMKSYAAPPPSSSLHCTTVPTGFGQTRTDCY